MQDYRHASRIRAAGLQEFRARHHEGRGLPSIVYGGNSRISTHGGGSGCGGLRHGSRSSCSSLTQSGSIPRHAAAARQVVVGVSEILRAQPVGHDGFAPAGEGMERELLVAPRASRMRASATLADPAFPVAIDVAVVDQENRVPRCAIDIGHGAARLVVNRAVGVRFEGIGEHPEIHDIERVRVQSRDPVMPALKSGLRLCRTADWGRPPAIAAARAGSCRRCSPSTAS